MESEFGGLVVGGWFGGSPANQSTTTSTQLLYRRHRPCRCRSVPPAKKIVRPREEVLPVRRVGVAAVVLPPRQLAVEQPDVHRGHALLHVVVGDAEGLRTEQAERRLRRDGGHVAPLLVEPLRIALLGNAVADEGETRCAERDELVRVDGNVARV